MADAAARREARRKRILENSENRLQRITGSNVTVRKEKLNNSSGPSSNSAATNLEHDNVTPDTNASPEPGISPNHIFDKTHLKDEDILIHKLTESDLRKRNIRGSSVDDVLDSTNHAVRNERFSPLNERQTHIVNKDTNESDQEVNPHDSIRRVSTQTSFAYSVFASKWILVLFAAFVNVLYFSQLQHLYGKTILAPFFALMLARLHLDDSNSGGQSGSMLSAALILCNIRPELVHNLRWVMRIFKKITEEFAIYIFSYVIFYNTAFSYWNDIDITISSIDSGNDGEFE